MNTLTAGHYRAQLALRASVLRRVVGIWPAFDITDIDRSWGPVQQALTAVVWAGHRSSSDLAGGYYRAIRAASGVPGRARVTPAPAPTVEYLDRALGYVGLIVPKKLVAQGRKDAAAQTLVHVAGTVGRLVLNGSRDTLLGTVRDDPQAKGWERVASPSACDFCSMLAGRGAVYSADTGDFEAHDHCSCTAEPVFAT